MNTDLDAIRREYLRGGLRRKDLPADPLDLFRHWQGQTLEAGLIDPTAMVLATVDEAGQPSQRIVLLKGLDDGGFVFYTNYSSRLPLSDTARDRAAGRRGRTRTRSATG